MQQMELFNIQEASPESPLAVITTAFLQIKREAKTD